MPKIPNTETTEKVKMDEDSYKATVLEMNGPVETTYNGQVRQKLIVIYDIDGAPVQQWMTNIVSEGSGKYSPSALCIWLEKMGLYAEFNKRKAELLDDTKFIEWVNNTLKATKPKVKVVVKNANKGTDNEYSTVSEVLKKL